MNILFSNSIMGFSKNSQKLANECPQPSRNTPQISLIEIQIFTPHSFFQSLVAICGVFFIKSAKFLSFIIFTRHHIIGPKYVYEAILL